MPTITLAQAGQFSDPIEVGPGTRITATGGYVQWTTGTLTDVRNGVATWQTWPAGAVAGTQDTLRRVVMRGVATSAMVLTWDESKQDEGAEGAYWQEQVPAWVSDVNGNAIAQLRPDGGSMPVYDLSAFSRSGDGSGIDAPWARAVSALQGSGAMIQLDARLYNQEAPLVVPDNMGMRGHQRATIIVCSSDIEQVVSARTEGVNVTGIRIENLRLTDSRSLTSAITRTNYQLRLTNPIACRFQNVETATSQGVTPDRSNLGGIRLEQFGGANCYVNEIVSCWVRQGVLRLEGSDNKVVGGFYWGNVNPAAVLLYGNNQQFLGVDFVGSPDTGSVWAPVMTWQAGFVGCFFDGSNSSVGGHGVFGLISNGTFIGNRFWYHQKTGIYLTGGQANVIYGNSFVDNNRANAAWSDVQLQPASGQSCKANVVTGNSFQNSITTTNKGVCILESSVDGGATSAESNDFRGNTRSLSNASGYSGYITSASRAESTAFSRSLIGPNVNMNQFNSGLATVLNGASTVTVTHNMGIAPLQEEIDVRPVSNAIGNRGWFVTNRTTTTFDIGLGSAAAADTLFTWAVRVGS